MRSFVLLAAFLALASASSLGLTQGSRTGNLVQRRNFLWQTRVPQQSPVQIQGAQIVNPQQQDVNSIYTQDAIQSAVAQQTAQQVLEQALLARQWQTIQGIQQLQRQLGVQGVTGGTDQVSTIEAIRNLQNWLQIQQLAAPQILVNSELTQTLETVIRAQLASNNVALNEAGTRTWNTQSFQTKVQQLIDISNIKEIEVEILNQQATISQLQVQQQLVAEQIQQIQSQQTISSTQLQNAVVELQQQGQQLTVEILARQLVIQQLQQALIQQQQQLQQDIQQQFQQGIQQQFQQGVQQSQQWNRQSQISSQTVNPFVGRWIYSRDFLPSYVRQTQNVV